MRQRFREKASYYFSRNRIHLQIQSQRHVPSHHYLGLSNVTMQILALVVLTVPNPVRTYNIRSLASISNVGSFNKSAFRK